MSNTNECKNGKEISFVHRETTSLLDHRVNRRHRQINVLFSSAAMRMSSTFHKKSAAHIKILIRLSLEIDSIITSRQQRYIFLAAVTMTTTLEKDLFLSDFFWCWWINVRGMLSNKALYGSENAIGSNVML